MAKSPENSQPPKAEIDKELPSSQVEVTEEQAEQVHAKLGEMLQSLKDKAPKNAQRASKAERITSPSPDDEEAINNLKSGLTDELIS